MDPERLLVILGMVLWPFEPFLCVLAFRRRVWRVLPCFAVYVVALVIVDTARWIVGLQAGLYSKANSWTYWLTQPVLIIARAAALADICRAALRPYAGIWRLAKPLLMVTATVLMALAAVRSNAANPITSYILFAERELEFAILLSLVALLLVSRYFGVALDRPLNGIALGMGLYSSYVIIEYTIILQQFQIPWWVFSVAGSIAYTAAVVIWLRTLWAPLPLLVKPELSTAESYEQDSLAVGEQMKEVNDRLTQLTKP